ncbi:MAG TPA: hypothetical protein VN915_08675 [Elusimicrobiota bacterium]|nr:hypothetical protein [Elusimicrobiota bacterium]
MRSRVWAALLLVGTPFSAAAQADGDWAAAAAGAIALRPPAMPQRPTASSSDQVLRAALLARLKRNPVAAEFALPILEENDAPSIVLRSEAEDASLRGAWATYKRDSRTLVLNRDAIASDLGGTADAAALAERYLPVFVHELGGHARHYERLAKTLGAPAPNARETEIIALRLEAMAVAVERKTNPSYLRDDKEYAKTESSLVDKYWESKEKRDPALFSDFVSGVPGYKKIPFAAAGPVADYYRGEEKTVMEADRRLIGDDPPADEAGLGRRETFGSGMRGR